MNAGYLSTRNRFVSIILQVTGYGGQSVAHSSVKDWQEKAQYLKMGSGHLRSLSCMGRMAGCSRLIMESGKYYFLYW